MEVEKICKNCKFFQQDSITLVKTTGKSVNDTYDDLVDVSIDGSWQNMMEDEWYRQQYSSLKEEKRLVEIGKCTSNKILYGRFSEEEDFEGQTLDCLKYEDSEDYFAHHNVGPNFGCIHFKQK